VSLLAKKIFEEGDVNAGVQEEKFVTKRALWR
jgi:hypothetical protein